MMIPLWFVVGVLAATGAMDVGSTMMVACSAGGGYEANPLLAWAQGCSPVFAFVIAATKLIGIGAVVLADVYLRMEKIKPEWLNVYRGLVLLVGAGLWALAATTNIMQLAIIGMTAS